MELGSFGKYLGKLNLKLDILGEMLGSLTASRAVGSGFLVVIRCSLVKCRVILLNRRWSLITGRESILITWGKGILVVGGRIFR